jgi:hypothetical protein
MNFNKFKQFKKSRYGEVAYCRQNHVYKHFRCINRILVQKLDKSTGLYV